MQALKLQFWSWSALLLISFQFFFFFWKKDPGDVEHDGSAEGVEDRGDGEAVVVLFADLLDE